MSYTPFERPIVLDLRPGRLGYVGPALWAVALVHVASASIAPGLKLGLLIWAVAWLTSRVAGHRPPQAARWHPATGWHVRLPGEGWQPALLQRAHPISIDVQLLCWAVADGRRWAGLVVPHSASPEVRRRLRVLLRLGRFSNDG